MSVLSAINSLSNIVSALVSVGAPIALDVAEQLQVAKAKRDPVAIVNAIYDAMKWVRTKDIGKYNQILRKINAIDIKSSTGSEAYTRALKNIKKKLSDTATQYEQNVAERDADFEKLNAKAQSYNYLPNATKILQVGKDMADDIIGEANTLAKKYEKSILD